MENLNTFFELDFKTIVIGIFIALSALTFMYNTIAKVAEIIGKPIKWFNRNDNDHKLLKDNIKATNNMIVQHQKDKQALEKQTEIMKQQFDQFMTAMKNEMQKYNENRINDRKQSFDIQKQLTDAIDKLTNQQADCQVKEEVLIQACKEVLGGIIDEKFDRYLKLDGIPENELKDWDNIYNTYDKLHGNGSRKHKYVYVKNHMEVLPVEVTVMLDDDENQ